MEAAYEDDHGAELLYDDGGVGGQLPELVRADARVALKRVEEGCFIGVVVWVCGVDELRSAHDLEGTVFKARRS